MPLKTIEHLTLSAKLISKDKITIHGFIQITQKAMGAVILSLRFGDLITKVKFYVINADTSYGALLGHPWLHQNHIIPSTLHQCVKYVKEGKQKRIDGDIQPFAVHEAGFEEAKYFLNTAAMLEKHKKPAKPSIRLWGDDTDSSIEEEIEHISQILPTRPSSSEEDEEVYQSSLAIERVPENHQKGLSPKQVNQVQEL